MALETLAAIQAALVATEIIAAQAIKANLPSLPMLGLVHHDTSMDGAGSNTKRYPVESDLGRSSGGTEGVSATNTVQLTYGSSIELSPTEGVLDQFEITEDALMRRLGGAASDTVLGVLMSGNQAQIERLLAVDVQRVVARCYRKIHDDLLALLTGSSQSVGTSGSDISILNLLQARYRLKKNKPHLPPSRWAYFLASNQVNEIELEALTTSDGLIGTLWTQQADVSIINRPGDEWAANGFQGSFLRHPVYECNESEMPTANAGADIVGSMMGVPANIDTAPDDPSLGGKCGPFVLLIRHLLRWRFAYDEQLRAMRGVVNARYIAGEINDAGAVAIITDAP